jgi:hypothetical protein
LKGAGLSHRVKPRRVYVCTGSYYWISKHPPRYGPRVIAKPAHLLTLAEAVDQIYFGASCEDCKRGVRRIDLAHLLRLLEPRILVQDIRTRLRCSECGGKNVIISTLWKDNSMSERMIEHWK